MIGLIPKHHTAHTLLHTLRWLKQDPSRLVRVKGQFPEQEYTLAEFKAWFMDCLADKINRNQPNRGRKDCSNWFWNAWRTSQAVNTPRLIVHHQSVPLEFRGRLVHRLTHHAE